MKNAVVYLTSEAGKFVSGTESAVDDGAQWSQ